MLSIIACFNYRFFLTDVSGFDVDSANPFQLLHCDYTRSELLVKPDCFHTRIWNKGHKSYLIC